MTFFQRACGGRHHHLDRRRTILPPVITVPTTGWTAAEAYTQTFALRYQTIAAGEGQLDDGSRGKFDGYTATRWTSYFSLDLSGDTPVIRLVS